MQKGITSFFQRVATPSGGAADTKSKPAETARPAAAPAPAPKPTVVVHSMPSTNTASPAVVKTAVVTKRKVIEDDDENDAAVPAAVPLAVAMSDVNEFDSEVAAKPTPEAASGKRLKRSPTEDSDDDIPVITAKPVVAPMFSSPSAKTAAIFTGSAKSSPAVSTPPASVKPSPASTTPSARVGPSASFKSTPPSQSPLASAGASKGSAYDDRGKLQNALLADWFVNRRDKHKNAPGDPDYDPRTLYIPPGEFKNMTPAQAQYWQIKAENMDIVLFFKMGKFYELFDEDAEIGARELDLAYMTGKERLHVGFPEGGYSKYAERLVRLGYKVGRVEQVETVNAQKQRVQDKTTARNSVDDKVVKRDMCSVLTKGTLCDADLIGHDDASYLLALCEDMQNIGYGICLVDTASGAFRLGQFRDDAARSRLRTLLTQLRPEEVVLPRDALSETTWAVLRKDLPLHTWEKRNLLKPGVEFWAAATTVDELTKGEYFQKPNESELQWPTTLQSLIGKLSEPAVADASNGAELTLSALGAAVWYLRRVLLDTELVSLGNFALFDPAQPARDAECLLLDGSTLANLEILLNQDGTASGSLLSLIDRTSTAFGKRLFRQWLTRPLLRACDIEDRLAAVDDLMAHQELTDAIRPRLRKLPDLERALARIHSMGVGRDRNAVMYENVSEKRLKIFLGLLDGFEQASTIAAQCAKQLAQFKSARLRSLISTDALSGGAFPDLTELLKFFRTSFDEKAARAQGCIVLAAGVDEELDAVMLEISEVEAALQEHLKEQRDELRDRSIVYFSRGKERYQLEVPAKLTSKVPDHYELMSQTKVVSRYWTPTLREEVQRLTELEERRDEMQREAMRRLFVRFASHYDVWMTAVRALAELDALLSLATYSANADGPMCRPVFVAFNAMQVDGDDNGHDVQSLELRGAWHPSVAATQARGSAGFIPNDIVLGSEENPARFVLVTGPNMGGKSTTLRLACIAVIMAQLGCYVPAVKCELTPVDRIFTRIGAHDRILAGQSTFFVELEETATILRSSTSASLVILDELGRGTSTFDGTAIAYAVIHHLKSALRCRCLFSTHYAMLTEEFADDPAVANYHMAYAVGADKESVTFLYRFVKGTCNKSHGMNVARLAGLPDSLVTRAALMADKFESSLRAAHRHAAESKVGEVAALRQLIQAKQAAELRSMLRQLK